MAVFDGLQASLTTMQPLQLMAAFVAAATAALAIDTSVDVRLRQAAIGIGALAAGLFVLLAGGWVSGLLLVALGFGAMALFVAAVRLLSRLLDIDHDDGPGVARQGTALETTGLRVARRTLPQRPKPAIRAI